MSSSLRFGVIGTGNMGQEHIVNLLHIDGAEVVALADPDEGSRSVASALVPGATAYEDYQDLLGSGSCDALVIATPNFTHVDVLLDAMSTDHHIMIEKPLCTTVADCKRVIAAQAERTPMTWMGLEYRYMPPIARVLQEVRAGFVGRVHMVAIREHRYPFLVKVRNWNRLNEYAGGTLVEKCCHFFDMMNLIVGTPPRRVLASGGQNVNFLDEIYDGQPADMLDNAYVIVEYDGGVRAMLDLCMFAEGSKNEQELSVVGDEGKAEALLPESVVRLAKRTDHHDVTEFPVTDERIKVQANHWGSSYLELLEFSEAIHAGTPPKVTLEEGMMSVAVGVAAQRSIAEGKAVLLSEVL